MSINQVNLELNDAVETYYPKMKGVRLLGFKIITKLTQIALNIRRNSFGSRQLFNERIVEYPLITRWLNPGSGGSILDIGCCSSRLPIQLASLGFEVHGLDVRDYNLSHPNFHFHKSDIFEWTTDMKFDVIISISVIEHFGMGGYGDTVIDDGDIKAVGKMAAFLEQGGHLLISMPFGKAGRTHSHRVYDTAGLRRVFKKFEIVEEAYFQRFDDHWLPSSAEKLSGIESLNMPVSGVVVLNLRLNKD